ncbi:hypothetical protein [Saccharolobus shibatae]|uniref:Uncharacterized protein n=1 Tax=Saccharolobus shibatae TaxID=2286 RepID=A0A8F5BW93_9CREN|nr:hypothetical protein [Saccharolobus shibatae]QXJ32614.1 hypothetical protein J5U21_02265 [Saccharolobus shibatae]
MSFDFDFLRRLRPINNYDEEEIRESLSAPNHNKYAGLGPHGGSLYRASITDPSNHYISKDVYVEVRSMGGYPYIAGVYEEEDYEEEEDYDYEEEDYYENYEEEEDYDDYHDEYDYDEYYGEQEEEDFEEGNEYVPSDPFGGNFPNITPPLDLFNNLLGNYFNLQGNHEDNYRDEDYDNYQEDYYEDEDNYYDEEEDDYHPY